FARLNLTYTVMSKRRLLALVEGGHVSGWDDPRMPTLSGLRRRGVPPEAIRTFCERVGVAKRNSTVEVEMLEHAIREELNRRAPRAMAVLRPLRLVIENWPADRVEELEAVNNPEDPTAGTRRVPFGRELWIERDDFREVPPPKYFRLAPGREVRLRWAYVVRCTGVEKDPRTGEVTAVRCTADPASRGGDARGRKVKATIHWVSARPLPEAAGSSSASATSAPTPSTPGRARPCSTGRSRSATRGPGSRDVRIRRPTRTRRAPRTARR